MTTRRLRPSEIDAECLDDLVADCAELNRALRRLHTVEVPPPRIDVTLAIREIRVGEVVSDQLIRLADYEYF
jgi:hypothetical protein